MAQSVYLNEVARNPGFVHFIVRDLQPFAIDLVGADITGERRVQPRSGEDMYEGSAPDSGSRLAAIGELGALVQRRDGWSAVIYDRSLSWVAE